MINKCWPRDRREELALLQELLGEVAAINSGSRCLERISLCIDTANRLLSVDLYNPRESFIQFLSERASGE